MSCFVARFAAGVTAATPVCGFTAMEMGKVQRCTPYHEKGRTNDLVQIRGWRAVETASPDL